jgi:hypothetical protein
LLLTGIPDHSRAQLSGSPTTRHTAFEELKDSQWVRLASPHLGRRQGRLLEHNATGLTLTRESQPLLIPAAAIDTLWTRGRSTTAGAVIGAILVGGLGALAGNGLGEENAGSARMILGTAGLGAIAGGLMGAIIGTAVPRWQRRYP